MRLDNPTAAMLARGRVPSASGERHGPWAVAALAGAVTRVSTTRLAMTANTSAISNGPSRPGLELAGPVVNSPQRAAAIEPPSSAHRAVSSAASRSRLRR